MRIAIGGLLHETNTFSDIPTTYASFHEGRDDIHIGAEVLDDMRGAKSGIGGMIEVIEAAGWTPIGLISAHATPSGDVQAAAFDALVGHLVSELRAAHAAQPVDGVLLYLHGAMLAENHHDAETAICRAVREVIGYDIPLAVELDLHGNITAEFVKEIDILVGYDTNPHVDSYERGVEAATYLVETLEGRMVDPAVYISRPPMLPPTINMRTAEGPMRELLERGAEWEAHDSIIDVSIFGGFAFADFADAGTSILVTATDPALGQQAADDIGRFAWSIRDTFLKTIPDVPAAVELAVQSIANRGDDTRPVILADVADNPGGGGSGDTTELLHEVLRRGLSGAAACVWDPETAQQAAQIGVGNSGTFRIAGKASDKYGAPLEVTGIVRHLSDGHFVGHGPLMRGRRGNAGLTATIDVNGFRLVVTSFRHAANDRGYFRVGGVDPDTEPLLIIKSRGHFRADFQPHAHEIIEVDAPGAANPFLERTPFERVRRPIWPLDADVTWK